MSNIFSFVGACGADAEIRYIPSGQAVLSVNVANNVGFGDKQKTMWIRVTLWGKRAESNLKDYLKKGQQVFVSGELTTNEYTANDGSKRTSLELNATTIDLIGKRESASSYDAPVPAANHTSSSYPQQPSPQHYAPPPQPQTTRHPASKNIDPPPYDDDVPF